MKVLKFGGTSMKNAASIEQVVNIIRNKLEDDDLLVVVSALKGTTEALIQTGLDAARGDESYQETLAATEQKHLETVKQLLPVLQQSSILSLVKKYCNEIEDIAHGIFCLREFSLRTRDNLTGYGEILSSRILHAAIQAREIPALWKDTRELITTDTQYTHAKADLTRTYQQTQAFIRERQEKLVILPGFIAADHEGRTTTLGRNSSDYSAALLAAGSHACALEIWTDVNGMMTADPGYVKNARTIPAISYEDAMELSHFGAKVIYPPTLQPVMQMGIPTHIKNTFSPEEEGTLIESATLAGSHIIKGISCIDHIALLSLEGSGMIGVPGFSHRLFEALNHAAVNVIMITQGSSEHSICVAVETSVAGMAKTAADNAFEAEIAALTVKSISVEENLSILAVVGENMKSRHGVSGKMFGALGRNAVNIRAIAQGSSERNISAIIASADIRKALNVLHETFFEATYKQVNLYLAGVGNVGKRLIGQVLQQQEYLKEHMGIQLNITGMANSRQALVQEEGIDLEHWEQAMLTAPVADIGIFTSAIIAQNLRNSIFADVTASEEVSMTYPGLLERSVSVVACNKIAASSGYRHYRMLKDTARSYNAAYLFETNVGAGLPIIGTLNDLTRSGDRLFKVEAVLSGTLNFVFNHYDGSASFATVVKRAQEEGYTEPDPRLDLSGRDVMRKILILAREAGYAMEEADIANNTFMPEACMQGSVADFYENMEEQEAHFRELYEQALAANCKLKFVARLEQDKASVGLQQVCPGHDLYHLYGKDNVVLFYTERYREQPLVIKGAGAGAAVTASGVFADILRAAVQ